MKRVEVRKVDIFECPECGMINWLADNKIPIDDMDERERMFRETNQLEPWSTLPEGWEYQEYQAIPTEVGCGGCNSRFITQYKDYDDDGT